jgi:signal transduction histidine kinase/ActR/RegA family two-component response regulator
MTRIAAWLGKVNPFLAHSSTISMAGKVKLLGMTFARIVFGVSIMPFVAMPMVWFYALQHDATYLIIWAISIVVIAVVLHWTQRLYTRYKLTHSDVETLSTWQPRIEKIAFIHGAILSLPMAITAGTGSFEFCTLLYIVIAAVTAANATHQTPVLGVFLRFFVAGWHGALLFIYWALPNHWQFVLPLGLIFSVSIYRHSLIAHRFFIEQVQLEERSVLLAAQYKTAKDEVDEVLNAKNQFLITASHDLRQPVHAMGMLTETIKIRNKDDALVPLLGDLQTSIRSLNQMFNSLLDLTKIETGAAMPSPVQIDLRHTLTEIVTLFREAAHSQNLQLRLVLPSASMAIWADPALLHQTLVNLVHNALRYTLQGGILVGARKRGSSWQIEIWDTGMGVANEEKEHIYSPFYRNQHAWRIDSSGHGLGLSVVARCANLMGATYGLTSKLGRGSRFWLRLAAADQVDVSVLSQPPHRVNLATNISQRLEGCCLILEDDLQASKAWSALMTAWGVEVHMASCATEAFNALDAGFEPNVVLCDQRLRSGESGFDILRSLLARCPDAYGAMISGEFNSPELMHAEDEGYLVLRKPVEASELYTLLSMWLQAKAQRSYLAR